jgi:hypothetical protein
MADYVVRVEAATSEAESKLRKVERQISNIDRDVKVNVQLPSIQQATSALQTFATTAANVGKTALDLSRKLNVGPGAVLNDLEDLFGKVAKKGEQTLSVFEALSKATPTRILGTSFDAATSSVDRFSKQVANLGFVLFGVTQSVNVLKQAFGGFFDDTIGREIRLQESLLRTKTTLISTADVMRNGQRITDPFQALTALDRPIEKTLENIRRRSLDIAGTTSDAIVQVFGVVASQVGAIGGSLKDAEDLAITFAGALGTIGMSDPMLANQEIRSILTGNIDQNSVLARSLGITNEEVQKAKRSSEGLVAYLTKRLEGFTAGQKLAAQGFAGIVSNIQEVREEASRSFGKPLLEPLLNSLSAVYDRLSLIFDQVLAISTNAGKAAANLTSGLLGGIASAPVLQNLTPQSQTGVANEVAEATKNFAANVEREIDKVRPIISRITNEVIIAIARISQGLAALLKGFAYFKFEELKILATAFANIAGLLNATVVPALQTMLNLYGAFLELPLVNYLAQVQAQHVILERLGVNSILRLIATWKFYQESINTAIGWVRNAANFISTAFKATTDAIANSISTLGSGLEAVLSRAVSAISQALIFVIRLISGAIREIGVYLMRLAVQLQTAFSGQALGQVGVVLADIASKFINIDRSTARAAQSIRNFSTRAQQDLQAVGAAADQAATRVRGLGAALGGALVTGIQKLGSALRGLVVGFIKFQALLFVVQAGAAAVADAVGRYQRAAEQATAGRRTDEAIERLSTVYKDLGDNVDIATKRAAAFERQLVETRFTQNQQEIEELSQKIGKLKREMDTPGIQSWGELMRTVFVNPVTAVQVLIDRFSLLKKGADDIRNSISLNIDGFTRWIRLAVPAVEGLYELFGFLVKELSAVIDKVETLADKFNNQRFIQGLLLLTNVVNPAAMAGGAIDKILSLTGNDLREEIDQRNLSEDEDYRQSLIEENQRIAGLLDREEEAKNIALAQKARQDSLKELKEYERQLDKQLFDERQALARKEVEVYKAAELFKIEQVERANAKKLEGEEGASEAALAALNDYITTKKKGELEISTIQKELAIELANLDRKVVDYRYEMEKRIADIRMKAAQYDAQVAAAVAAGATGAGMGSGQAFVGSTGTSTGPHADIRGENLNSVIEETVQAVLQFQKDGAEYIQLSNAKIDVKNITDPVRLRAEVRREIDAHAYRRGSSTAPTSAASGTYAADIAVPSGTRVPVPLGPVQWDPRGGGFYGTNPGTGNRWLHLAEGSQGGSSSSNLPSTGSSVLLNENAARWSQAISNFEGTRNRYDIQYGGGTFDNSKPHPMSGSRGNLTPYGKHQYQGPTWLDAHGGRNLPMTPENQDRAFLWATRRRGVNISTDPPTPENLRKLKDEFSSLPAGTEPRGSVAEFRQAFNAPLATGPAAASGGATPGAAPPPIPLPPPPPIPLPPPLPGAVTGKALELGEDIIAVQGKLQELLRREAELKKQIAEANSKEKLEAVAKQLFPTVPLERFRDAQLELQETLEQSTKFAGAAFDPERLAIAVDLTTRRKIAARELAEFEKKQKELTGLTEADRKKIDEDIKKRQEDFNNALEEEGKLRLENLRLQRQSQAVMALAKDQRDLLYNTRGQIFEAGLANEALNFDEDDFLARRMQDAQRNLFQKRTELEQSNLDPRDIEKYLATLEPQVIASAQALAELDSAAANLAERLALVKQATDALVGGYKGFLSSVLSGTPIKEAAAQMAQTISGKFVDMMLDYAFKPIEKQIEGMWKDFFKVDDAQKANTTAINNNSAKFEALTTKLGELITALNAPTAPTTPTTSTTPTATTASPQSPTSGLFDFSADAPSFNVDSTPVDFTIPEAANDIKPFQVPAPDFKPATDSLANLEVSTKNFAKGVETSAKTTTEGTDATLTNMQKYATGLASVATAALSIVGGIQMIQEGDAGSVLMGIGSIFLGVAGGISGVSSFFPQARASGGMVSANAPYLVGEKGPELFVPNSFGSVKPNNSLREAMNTTIGSQNPGSSVEFRFQSEVINRREYVSLEQLEAAQARTRRQSIAEGARRGMAMTLDRFENSPRTRARAGFRR